MKKILCPTDLSATSFNAIAYAAKLARVTNGELTLLNVQSLFDIVPVEVLTGNRFTVQATTERLQEQCEEVSRVFHINCKCEVEATYHRLSTVISERSKHYDLLIMGSNGADDLYQFFLGTNTYNALTKAATPVLIVPEGYLYSDIKKIVFSFDYLRQRKLPMEPLVRFARTLNAEITVLQIMEEAVSKEADQDLKELQFILGTQAEGYPFRFDTVRSSDIPRSIDSYIANNEPDVLALCVQDRNFIENLFHKSVIKKISAICNYPIFVFHQ